MKMILVMIFYSDGEYIIEPQKVVLVNLGIAIQLPKNVGGFVLPRSGLASKNLVAPINSPGLIDPGYTGELMVPLNELFRSSVYTFQKMKELHN